MSDPSLHYLVQYLVEGDRKRSLAEVEKLLDAQVVRERIITQGVEEAMRLMENKCTVEQFNLLEIMVTGRAAMEVITYLYPQNRPSSHIKGTIVTGTLEGDVHDLGKNILKTVLTTEGYLVIDCGKDCSLDLLTEAVKKNGAFAVCISGLITSVIPLVRQVKKRLDELGLRNVRVVAGGAALKQATAESLNVDFVCNTAFDATAYLKKITGEDDEQH